jgi:hypothetical protein
MKARILGISFCTRMVGLAVLESTTLIDCSVKLYKEKWSSAKMETILASLTSAVSNYNITHIVLSIAPVYFQGEPFLELWQEMIIRFHSLRIPVTVYRLAELQLLVGGEEKMSRNLLMECLSKRYTELGFYARIERRNKHKYYYKMFEAVGVATLHYTHSLEPVKTSED